MANDCLVTKLKGVVNNLNLLTLGMLRITTTGTAQDGVVERLSFFAENGKTGTIKSINNNSINTTFGPDGIHVTSSQEADPNFQHVPIGTVLEVSKYDLNQIDTLCGSISYPESLRYHSATQISIKHCDVVNGYLKDIIEGHAASTITVLYISESHFKGDIDEITYYMAPNARINITWLGANISGLADNLVTKLTNGASLAITGSNIDIHRSVYEAAIARGVTFILNEDTQIIND